MDIHYYIGIDISKATLDWAIFDGKTLTLQTTTPNTVTGIKTALRQLKILAGWNPKQVVFCTLRPLNWTTLLNNEVVQFKGRSVD